MSKVKFIEKKFAKNSLQTIAKSNEILEEYGKQVLVLSLRQLFYQHVSRGLMENKQSEYKRLGSIISDARLAGLIDWDRMEDRTRTLRRISKWEDPAEIVAAVAEQYKEDLWRTQPVRVECWIEKDALVGVIERVCRDWRIEYFACRGYASQSAQYEAGMRIKNYRDQGQDVVILHLGDHDPSGIDMSRDNKERLTLFSGDNVRLKRLALNMDQIKQYNPPPNPAKEADTRAGDYIEKFGSESWELDALEPRVIDALIRNEVKALIDQDEWDKAEEIETAHKKALQRVSDHWSHVEEIIRDMAGGDDD